MSVGLESLPLAETTPNSHLVNPSASDDTEHIGLIIMLCLTIGIIFGLIGLTIWMTKNRNVRYTILAKLMSLFIFLEQISCKNERHNMEDADLESNTRQDIGRAGEAGDVRQPRHSREVRELLQAINDAPDTPMVTRSGEAGDVREQRVTRNQSNTFRPIIFANDE